MADGWRPSKQQHYWERPENWDESWKLEETCCHSDSSEKPSANADVKSSNEWIIIKARWPEETCCHSDSRKRSPIRTCERLVEKKQRRRWWLNPNCKLPVFKEYLIKQIWKRVRFLSIAISVFLSKVWVRILQYFINTHSIITRTPAKQFFVWIIYSLDPWKLFFWSSFSGSLNLRF